MLFLGSITAFSISLHIHQERRTNKVLESGIWNLGCCMDLRRSGTKWGESEMEASLNLEEADRATLSLFAGEQN